MAETLISVDLTKSPLENENIHNRWHPDIPMACWVNPGDDFILETFDWTGGFIKNNDSADDVRDIERRIQKTASFNSSGEPRALPGAPVGVPDSFEEHIKLMFDLQAVAFASDITRVFSFKTGRDASSRTFPESGTNKGFHPASHHGGRESAILEFNQINQYHVSMLPYFLQRLKDTTDGDSNLLDNTLIMYGSPMADGNIHNHRRCPLLLLGGGNGILPGNVHLKAPDGTPMADVMLTLLHRLGVDTPVFGDSVSPFALHA